MADSVRTCIGCGEKGAPAVLVRLALEGGRVVVDRARRGGRGAWIHAAEACIERAARRKAFGRALRAPGVEVDLALLRESLTRNARKD
jgi:predicted RNA-binding protein YlxR (DUF448 family)